MKKSSNIIISKFLIGIICLSLSFPIAAQENPPPPRNTGVENLILFGIDLPFLSKHASIQTPQEPPSTPETPNAATEIPAIDPQTLTPPNPIQPNLTQLYALMRDPSELGEITASPIVGLYQIVIDNEIYYLSQDGRYLFEGNLLDLSARQNLSDIRRNQIRAQLLAQLAETDVISFKASKSKYQVTVFIDIDCPYCRVVFENADQYNQLGISLRFAPFPRNGLHSSAHSQLSAIWCSSDRKLAMQQVHHGLILSASNCESAIRNPHLIGMKMGINTTPTFVLENGSLIQGFVAPQNLQRLLSESKK